MTETEQTTVFFAGTSLPVLLRFRSHLMREFVKRGYRVVATAPETDPLDEDRLRKLGVEYRAIAVSRTGNNPLSDLYYMAHLFVLLERYKARMLFAFGIKPVIYSHLAAQALRIKERYALIPGLGYAFSDIDTVSRGVSAAAARILYRLALRECNRIFVQNKESREVLKAAGVVRDAARIELIDGSGVDLDEYAYTEPPVADVSFLFMGRLLREKGVLEYLEAARRLRQHNSRVKCVLLGSFYQSPTTVKERDVADYVRDGAIEYGGDVQDVRPFLNACSVFVLPSYYLEGIPRSLLEALATGRPVVTTDWPGCREAIVDPATRAEYGPRRARNGFLVEPKNVDHLRHAMQHFVDNPGEITPMGLVSRTLAERRFDIHKVNAAILGAMLPGGTR